MTSAASLPVLIPCDSGHRVSSTCNTESLIGNKQNNIIALVLLVISWLIVKSSQLTISWILCL